MRNESNAEWGMRIADLEPEMERCDFSINSDDSVSAAFAVIARSPAKSRTTKQSRYIKEIASLRSQ